MPAKRGLSSASSGRPELPSGVYARDGIRGTGVRPAELESLANRRSFWVESDGAAPEVSVRKVSERGASVYEVSYSGRGQSDGHLAGRTQTRQTPDEVRAQIEQSTSLAGNRPEWADMLFTPRPVPSRVNRPIRRFNRRPVDPYIQFNNPDHRQVFADASYPWCCIGKIQSSDGTSATGVLVGDRVVLTAGHAVPWTSGSWWVRFTPSYYDGSSLLGDGVVSYVSDMSGFDGTGDCAGWDHAVLRLYEPLGNMLGFMGWNPYDEDWNDEPWWMMAGYPGAIAMGQRPSWQGTVSIWDVDNDDHDSQELESQTCDTGHGDSGGPMFSYWGSDPRIIGTVVGAEEDYQFPFSTELSNVMGGGSGLHDLIAWARATWPL